MNRGGYGVKASDEEALEEREGNVLIENVAVVDDHVECELEVSDMDDLHDSDTGGYRVLSIGTKASSMELDWKE